MAANSRITNRRQTSSRSYNERSGGGLGGIFSNPIVAIVVVALVIVLAVVLMRRGGTVSKYYAQGVYINNVDMSKYTRSEGEKLVESWTNGLISKEYTFTYQDQSWTFSPEDVDAGYNTKEVLSRAWNLGHSGSASDRTKVQQSLRLEPQMLWVKLSYNEKKLDAFISSIANALYIEPTDAEIVLTATKPVIISDSKDGRELDTEAFRETLVGLMNSGSDTTVFELPVHTKLPSVSSDEAENGLQLIVTYSTSLVNSSTARCGNVKLALSNFNGFVVRPGETVSFNEVVGERSAIRGYTEGTVYYGSSVTTGMGGGVCQASSTLYGALMYAGMDVIERNHHSLVVDYCAASMDAAVSEDASQDFVFINDTDYAIYIYTNVINKESATVYIYGNRPEYRIDLVSTIVQNNIKNPAIDLVEDKSGEIAYYTTQRVLVKEGKLGRRSKLERIYYDWDTGVEVKRETLSEDYYSGERDIWYVGTHQQEY
ncbi:MAG: VanW family protein [Clostridia bacterium]|nr:VanW family protein [Clostridia bacterium]